MKMFLVFNVGLDNTWGPSYTPGIYAEGYIVFVFPFVRSYVRMFVRSFVRSFVCTSFRRLEFASKFCVKVSQVVYISATTHQKAFIFGPYLPWRVGIHYMTTDPRVHALGWGKRSKSRTPLKVYFLSFVMVF